MISVTNISVAYANGPQALAPTSLAFAKGDFTVLLGSSGAGKSTLLRTLNGLVSPSSGEVVLEDGQALHGAARLRAHRRQTGMIFQQHQLIGRLSVIDNVLIGRLGAQHLARSFMPRPDAEKVRALEAIARVGLIEHALRRADQLSGGQQQRVGIARALIQSPRLILADEPIASLDPRTADDLMGLLHTICKADGLTAIVSLHQLDFARRYADRIVALARGAVVFDGRPADLGSREIEAIYGVGEPAQRTTSLENAFEMEPAT